MSNKRIGTSGSGQGSKPNTFKTHIGYDLRADKSKNQGKMPKSN